MSEFCKRVFIQLMRSNTTTSITNTDDRVEGFGGLAKIKS